MKTLITICLLVAIVREAVAADFGNRAAIKSAVQYSSLPPNPAVLRQGGDTIDSALMILGVPFTDEGTTSGYTDDYDESCPYGSSTSPDVVYSYIPTYGVGSIDIDLCHSGYDTKVYVYDADLNLIYCNDDYYY